MLCNQSLAQTGTLETEANKRGNNRWEGMVAHAKPDSVMLLGFHATPLPAYSEGDALQVQFFNPEPTGVSIEAQQLSTAGKRYGMKAFPQELEAGWQRFEPWQVNDVLIPNSLAPKEVAVLVQTDSNIVLPAYVGLEGKKRAAAKAYTAHVHTPWLILWHSYTVLDVATGKVWYESGGEQLKAATPFQIALRLPANAPKGEYQFLLELTDLTGRKLKQRWTFLHTQSR